MAEAFAIIALTSSILTFIEFGGRITTTVRAIRLVADGKIPEVQELEKNLEEIRAKNRRALKPKSVGKTSKEELRIAATVNECDKIAADLRRLVAKLSTRPGAKFQAIETSPSSLKCKLARLESLSSNGPLFLRLGLYSNDKGTHNKSLEQRER